MTTGLSSFFDFIQSFFIDLYNAVRYSKFYQIVYNKYKNYGVFHSFTACFFGGLFAMVIMLYHVNQVNEYLKNDSVNSNTLIVSKLSYVLDNLPNIEYDGKNIKLPEKSSSDDVIDVENTNLDESDVNNYLDISDKSDHYIISDNVGNKILAIDPNNTINYEEKNTIPVVMTSENIVISLPISKNNKSVIPYDQIFGNNPINISKEEVRHYLSKQMSDFTIVDKYKIFGMLVISLFVSNIYDNLFPMLTLYLILRILNHKIALKSAMQLMLFASAPAMLLYPIFLFYGKYYYIPAMLKFWCMYLMTISFVRNKKHANFK